MSATAREVIARWEIELKLECNDCGQKAWHETPLGHHTADAILSALDAAGFKVIHISELSGFIRSLGAVVQANDRQ